MARKKIRKFDIQTKYGIHACIFEPDDGQGYIVIVPGLPGAITWGKNIREAKKMAKEVIELCIECYVEEPLLRKRFHTQSQRLGMPVV